MVICSNASTVVAISSEAPLGIFARVGVRFRSRVNSYICEETTNTKKNITQPERRPKSATDEFSLPCSHANISNTAAKIESADEKHVL